MSTTPLNDLLPRLADRYTMFRFDESRTTDPTLAAGYRGAATAVLSLMDELIEDWDYDQNEMRRRDRVNEELAKVDIELDAPDSEFGSITVPTVSIINFPPR